MVPFVKRRNLWKFSILIVVLIHFFYTRSEGSSVCSFDHIVACQTDPRATRGEFLYISAGLSGFASQINQVIVSFAYSIAAKRRFVIDSRRWNYGNFEDLFDFPYYFNVLVKYQLLVVNDSINEKYPYVKDDVSDPHILVLRNITQHVQKIDLLRPVAHYLWRHLTSSVVSFIQSCRPKNLSHYIGVHVRLGDKLVTEARPISLTKYIKQIEEILIKTGNGPIFVMSDSATALQKLQKLKPKWTFVSTDDSYRNSSTADGHHQGYFNSLSKSQQYQEALLLLCQLQVMIEADYVICTFSSNICRLIQTLRSQDPSTVISLDNPYFFL